MKQIYHPYWKWEEHKAGMWKRVSKTEQEKMLPIAIEFTGNHIKYGEAMNEVINNWKYSCENSLSNLSVNRKAWLGHAAVSFKIQIPEFVTRVAWGHLTQLQQDLANKQAENNILEWEQNQRSKTTFSNGNKDAITRDCQMRLLLN